MLHSTVINPKSGDDSGIGNNDHGMYSLHPDRFIKREFSHMPSTPPLAPLPEIGFVPPASSFSIPTNTAIPSAQCFSAPKCHWLFPPPHSPQSSDLISSPESMAIESNGQKGKFAYSGGREEEQHICNGSELERIIGHGGESMHFDLEDSELMRLSVRELNHKLAGHDHSIVSALKQKRRTLKNRGYALNCRTRRLKNMQQLEKENDELRKTLQKQAILLANYERKYGNIEKEGGKEEDGLKGNGKGKPSESQGFCKKLVVKGKEQLTNGPSLDPNRQLYGEQHNHHHHHFLYPGQEQPVYIGQTSNCESIGNLPFPAIYSHNFGDCNWASPNPIQFH